MPNIYNNIVYTTKFYIIPNQIKKKLPNIYIKTFLSNPIPIYISNRPKPTQFIPFQSNLPNIFLSTLRNASLSNQTPLNNLFPVNFSQFISFPSKPSRLIAFRPSQFPFSHPILRNIFPSRPALQNSFLSDPTFATHLLLIQSFPLSDPILLGSSLSDPTLLNSFLSNPILPNSFLSNPTLLNSSLFDPILPNPSLSYPILHNSSLSGPTLPHPSQLIPLRPNPSQLSSFPSSPSKLISFRSNLLHSPPTRFL